MGNSKVPASLHNEALQQIRTWLHLRLNVDEKEFQGLEWAQKAYERSIFFVRAFHEQHRRDDLPHVPAESVDEELALIFKLQDEASFQNLVDEHKMSLLCLLMAVGIKRDLALKIVDCEIYDPAT